MTYEADHTAGYYQEQSQRIRKLAADAHSSETRDQFLALAQQYERLAGQAASRPRSSPRQSQEYLSQEQL